MARGAQGNEIGSSSNHLGGEVAEEMGIVIDRAMNMPSVPQWLTDLTDEKDDGLEAKKDNLEKKPACKIQRVPPIFRESDISSKRDYEPLMISLGPFHHGKPNLQRMETLKISMVRRFIKGTGKPLELVYGKFLDVAKNAKTEYYVLETEDDIDNDKFLRILFVDICFLIQFILDRVERGVYEHTKMMIHEITFVQRDLYLLENQLPFPIVKALMMLRFSEDQLFEKIQKIITSEVAIRPKRAPWFQRMLMMMLPRKQASDENTKIFGSDHEPLHLLHALQMQLVDAEKLKSQRGQGQIWYSYRSVKELKAAGIHFRPRRRGKRLTDISFRSNLIYGVLSLKPMLIDDQTKARFLNVCAFETLHDAPGDVGVTSYICLLDSLIDTAEDVQELRSRGVIYNFLGSDQQVADMFNSVTDRLVPNPEAFAKVKSAIERHYSSRPRTWLAQILSTHFSSPWTVIGFLLAALAIALSIIQTFSLYHPHKHLAHHS